MVTAQPVTAEASVVETLLLDLWSRRHDASAIEEICAKLSAAAADAASLSKIELYLPQFAHMVVVLADELPVVVPLERFILTVCQLSIHVAIQFFWLVYASLQENRLKQKSANRATYRRCALLLLQLEQCIVYGGGGGGVAGATDPQRTLLQECARIASASLSASTSGLSEVVHSGLLKKKGGGTSRFGRRSWSTRYFELRDRVLYYYTSASHAHEDKTSSSDRPRGSMQLSSAYVSIPQKKKRAYPNYFEVVDKQSGLVFKLQAPTREAMARWLHTIQAVSAMPEPPGMPAKDLVSAVTNVFKKPQAEGASAVDETPRPDPDVGRVVADLTQQYDPHRRSLSGTLSTGDAAAPAATELYAFFNTQRDFIRNLTNMAEELRFMPKEERQEALQPILDALSLPPSTYFPLATSSEKCCRVLRIAPHESIVFNTKARCPVMLICEVQREEYDLAQIDAHLGEPSPAADGASASAEAVQLKDVGDAPPTLVEKKKEPWGKKVDRLKRTSSLASAVPGWELRSFFVKSNDDLRQEVFVMQMIRYFQSIWPTESVWLNAYHIEATGPDTGLVEAITASSDLDRLKKTKEYTNLRQLFIQRYGAPGTAGFLAAQDKFCKSLAGYAVVMWLLLLRDRHNGNLMLDEEGHYFHIDFGFILGHSTGKQIGGMIECSAFKLTQEYIDLLDGRGSPVYEKFCAACCAAMAASHAHAATICSMVEIVGTRSSFPCFQVFPVQKVIPKLRKRLMMDLPASAVPTEFRKIIDQKAAGHWGSRWYDKFQAKLAGYAV